MQTVGLLRPSARSPIVTELAGHSRAFVPIIERPAESAGFPSFGRGSIHRGGAACLPGGTPLTFHAANCLTNGVRIAKAVGKLLGEIERILVCCFTGIVENGAVCDKGLI